jgi:hypothetical protein
MRGQLAWPPIVRCRASAVSGSKPPFLARQFLIDFHSVAVANKKFRKSSFAAPLEVFAAVAFPPPALPHGVLFVEKPSVGATGVAYQLDNLPVFGFKIAAQLVDLAQSQSDTAPSTVGGYPDACTLLVADAGLVEVKADAEVTGIDIRLFDAMADPCFATIE